jgi:hypothetical protein
MAQRDEQDFLLRNLPTTQYHARFEPTLVPENDPEETFVNTPVLPGCPIIKVYLTDGNIAIDDFYLGFLWFEKNSGVVEELFFTLDTVSLMDQSSLTIPATVLREIAEYRLTPEAAKATA